VIQAPGELPQAQDPRARALREQALARLDQGKTAEAGEFLDQLLQIAPEDKTALYHLALITLRAGQAERSVALMDRYIALDAENATVFSNRGGALRSLGRLDDAYASFNQALSLKPGFLEAHINRGHLLRDAGRFEQAAQDYECALAINPDHFPAYLMLGGMLRELGRLDEAVGLYERVVARKPDFFEAMSNLGNVLNDQGRLDEALARYDHAITLRPDSPELHKNRGVTLLSLNRYDEALTSFDLALSLKPDMAEALWNKGLLYLTLGDYARGLPLYEHRKQMRQANGNRSFDAPLLTSAENVEGRLLFLHAEQGLGDTILFCRYARLLRERGAEVVLAVQPPLVNLIKSLDPQIRVISSAYTPSTADFHAPLMSLPLVFGTTVETIPANQRYLDAPAELSTRWAGRLPPRVRPRIGLAWAGSPLGALAQNRTIPLRQLAPLLGFDADWYSLHHETPGADAEALADLPQLNQFGAGLDFDNAAALIDQLDLVISADTSLANLAAALGKPVWMLLPVVADWRWMRDRNDTPWYPTVRLFRQPALGDWASVAARVGDELAAHFPPG
jgi:tetratricopeptide (TPR) repeat protein